MVQIAQPRHFLARFPESDVFCFRRGSGSYCLFRRSPSDCASCCYESISTCGLVFIPIFICSVCVSKECRIGLWYTFIHYTMSLCSCLVMQYRFLFCLFLHMRVCRVGCERLHS